GADVALKDGGLRGAVGGRGRPPGHEDDKKHPDDADARYRCTTRATHRHLALCRRDSPSCRDWPKLGWDTPGHLEDHAASLAHCLPPLSHRDTPGSPLSPSISALVPSRTASPPVNQPGHPPRRRSSVAGGRGAFASGSAGERCRRCLGASTKWEASWVQSQYKIVGQEETHDRATR